MMLPETTPPTLSLPKTISSDEDCERLDRALEHRGSLAGRAEALPFSMGKRSDASTSNLHHRDTRHHRTTAHAQRD
jgi:hypothetical protein